MTSISSWKENINKKLDKMDFISEFNKIISELYPDGLEWGLVGILTKQSKVYTLSYDSKVLSGMFEIFCEPIVMKIAEINNLIVEKSSQTAYPDFTLFRKGGRK